MDYVVLDPAAAWFGIMQQKGADLGSKADIDLSDHRGDAPHHYPHTLTRPNTLLHTPSHTFTHMHTPHTHSHTFTHIHTH